MGGTSSGPTKSERCGEIEMLAPESQMTGKRSVELQCCAVAVGERKAARRA